MLYYGFFENIHGTEYKVEISTKTAGNDKEIIFGGTPCVISQNGGALYDAMKPQSCTITIVTKDVLDDIYASAWNDVTVKVYDYTNSILLFDGYVTPQQYNQDFIYLSEIEIECVSKLSALMQVEYDKHNDLVAIYDLLDEYFGDKVEIMQEYYDIFNITVKEDWIYSDEDTPKSIFEILEAALKTYGLTMTEFNDKIYIIDYKLIKAYRQSLTFVNVSRGTSSTTLYSTLLQKNDYAGPTPNIEIDETYSRVEATANIEEYEEDINYGKEAYPKEISTILDSGILPFMRKQEARDRNGQLTIHPQLNEEMWYGRPYFFDGSNFTSNPFRLAGYTVDGVSTLPIYEDADYDDKYINVVITEAESRFLPYNNQTQFAAGDFNADYMNLPWMRVVGNNFVWPEVSCAYLTRFQTWKNNYISYQNGYNALIDQNTQSPTYGQQFTYQPYWSTTPDKLSPDECIVFENGLTSFYNGVFTTDAQRGQQLSNADANSLWYTYTHDVNHPHLEYNNHASMDYTVRDSTKCGFIIMKNVKFMLLGGREIQSPGITDMMWFIGTGANWARAPKENNYFNYVYDPEEIAENDNMYTPYELTSWEGDFRDITSKQATTLWTGFPIMIMEVKIGDKTYKHKLTQSWSSYWSNSTNDLFGEWITYDENNRNFNNMMWVYAHDDDPTMPKVGEENVDWTVKESLSMNKWLKTVRNWNYSIANELGLGEDDIVIPVPYGIELKGELEIKFYPQYYTHDSTKSHRLLHYEYYNNPVYYMTAQPYQVTGKYEDDVLQVESTAYVMPYCRGNRKTLMTVPSFEYKIIDRPTFGQNDKPWATTAHLKKVWAEAGKKGEDDDEIKYEHTNTTDYKYENKNESFDICSWRTEKPYSPNYHYNNGDIVVDILSPYDGQTNIRPEQMTVDKWAEHQSSPKYIYNLQVFKRLAPFNSVKTSTTENKIFGVDTQEWDVKQTINTIKLIEV